MGPVLPEERKKNTPFFTPNPARLRFRPGGSQNGLLMVYYLIYIPKYLGNLGYGEHRPAGPRGGQLGLPAKGNRVFGQTGKLIPVN